MMETSLYILLLLSCGVSLSQQRSTVADPDYVMGIVEFTPELPTVNWELRTVLHFENYTRIIRDAAEQGVDILVFPEYSLNNVAFPVEVPDPLNRVNPCLKPGFSDKLMADLSCLAREKEIYLCINLNERENCTDESQQARNDTRPCSSLGFTRYNSNVVFDRAGVVIGRYRKFNLFREAGVNTTLNAELSTFETDFGVTFGNIVCFDILFYEPAMKLVQMGIKNFIFPAMWTSELPFLTSNQIYQSWAYRNNVNLFAAGSNLAPAVATGTGFFLGRSGNVFTVFSEDPLREFYAMKIVKNPTQSNPASGDAPTLVKTSFKNLHFGRDLISDFETELIDLTTGRLKENELCHDEHCCSFIIEHEVLKSNATLKYRYIAFNGYRTYSGWSDKKLIICAIILCNDDTIDSCGRMPAYDLDQVIFNKIEITTTFNRFGVLMMPNSLDMNMDSLKVNEFSYQEVVDSETSKKSSIKLLKPRSDLQAFALYGHDYETADEFQFDDGKGCAMTGYITYWIFMVSLITIFIQ